MLSIVRMYRRILYSICLKLQYPGSYPANSHINEILLNFSMYAHPAPSPTRADRYIKMTADKSHFVINSIPEGPQERSWGLIRDLNEVWI